MTPAAFIAPQGVLPLAHRELANVIRQKKIQELHRAAAAHADFAHVRDVENPSGISDSEMFVDDAGVLNRHLPAAEFDQASAVLW